MKQSFSKEKLKGRDNLSIEYYNGSIIDEDRKQKHDRKFEHLELYLKLDPKTREEKKTNKQNLELTESILAIRKT